MSNFISFLDTQIRSFIMYRKASDHWNESSYELNLIMFDRYCNRNYPTTTELSQGIVDSWCKQHPNETNNSCRSRIYVVVSFIRYLNERGLTTVLEPNIPKKERRLYVPHAFTDTELKNFFYACDTLPDKPRTEEQLSRRISIPVFFRLLYSSGLRTNEARMLRVEDVNFDQGILNIRYSKGRNQHYVVLHDSMHKLLKRYDKEIAKQYNNRIYFFPARNNSFHKSGWVSKNFRILWDKYNSSYAIAYELRHHYAIYNINSWVCEGFQFNNKLLYLSKSMGHCNLESTKAYYAIVPRLAETLDKNTGYDFNKIIPEVNHEES